MAHRLGLHQHLAESMTKRGLIKVEEDARQHHNRGIGSRVQVGPVYCSTGLHESLQVACFGVCFQHSFKEFTI